MIPLDRILVSSPVVTVGRFQVAPHDRRFKDSGPIERHVFVFPRTAVRIRHQGGEPFVADPNLVTLYNCGQLYTRGQVSDEGDLCDWFAVAPGLLAEAASHFGETRDPESAPFARPHTPVDPHTFLLERGAVAAVESGAFDLLAFEERTLEILARLLRTRSQRRASTPVGRREPLAERAKEVLALDPGQPLSLDVIARRCGVSVFHLCRSFRRATGVPLHRYRMSLRLRRAHDLLAGGASDIAAVALAVGFTSHSHFTAAFRRAFGRRPSELRRSISLSPSPSWRRSRRRP